MPRLVQVVLPLSLPGTFSYLIPDEFYSNVQIGVRVEVQFGKTKHYAGLVESIQEDSLDASEIYYKPILQVLDDHPIVSNQQLYFWKWMAAYYCCYLGEVMAMALPPGLKISSDTSLYLNDELAEASDQEWPEEVRESVQLLRAKGEVKIDELKKHLGKSNLGALVNFLIKNNIALVKENLVQRYKAKKEGFVKLTFHLDDQQKVTEALEITKKSNRQTAALLYLVQMTREREWITRSSIYKRCKVDKSVLDSLEKKNLIQQEEWETSRLNVYKEGQNSCPPLTENQAVAIQEIEDIEFKTPILLVGVPGSGKTSVYIDLIKKTIEKGGQVLYLAPEISVGTQLVQRLKQIFGASLHPYHSRLNSAQRVEVWQAVVEGFPIVLGSRSSLFLPFQNLRLIIVDEEHDESYKQFFSNPKYHARDMALVLGRLTGARVVLGSATPSIESLYNEGLGKYKKIQVEDTLPKGPAVKIECVHSRSSERIVRHKFQLAEESLAQLKLCLDSGNQALLFINRRGFAPLYECTACAWSPKCPDCDVSLTYHRYTHQMHCHYCGHKEGLPKTCSSCGNIQFDVIGAGTQRVEDELQLFLPEARISRLDLDNVRRLTNLEEILQKMENQEIDILVGTKMITKGLNFQKLTLAIVVNADRLFSFPNFRAQEMALQLLSQLKGRIGRTGGGGKLLIQTSTPEFPLFKFLKESSYEEFYNNELRIREDSQYPPFTRLIKITLKHKEIQPLEWAAHYFCGELKKLNFNMEVLGPTEPLIARIRLYYHRDILLKIRDRGKSLNNAKQKVSIMCRKLESKSSKRGLKWSIDVDPV